MPPDSSPAAPSRKAPLVTQTDTEAQVDMVALRAYRLGRVRAQLRQHDYAGALLFDPVNIRYATGSRNMAVWTLHNPARYCFVPTEGPVVLFDYHNCDFMSDGLETVDEVRRAVSWFYFAAGPRVAEKAKLWAAEVADLVKAHGGGNRRLAMDHCDFMGVAELAELGVQVCDGQEVMERARDIKSAEELACMVAAVTACEAGMAAMREALEPGITENQLWSLLHQVNIALGGEWIETRLLSSGPRTNPWFQESSDRVIRAGELVSFDTDLIGPFGYCADISRTYFCGPGKPSDEQRKLYRIAYDQILHNTALLKPGVSFREVAEQGFEIPERCRPNRYGSLFHGVGLCDEYPRCPQLDAFDKNGYDAIIEPGQTLCVESYVGEEGGDEGVKLEQQVLITETGTELLSTFPFEDELLNREI